MQPLFWGSHQKRSHGHAVGLWGTVVLALLTRFLMWVAMTYFPQTVHGAESGLLMASIILAVSHLFVLVAAVRANPTT
jgi:hypothetical protein